MAAKYLTDSEIQNAGILDKTAVEELFRKYEHPDTPATDRVQLDALVNHVVGIQILHKQLIEQDVPALAAKQAEKLKWKVRATSGV
jgi:asparagine synthase (glutamine-hydrolysing)